MKRLLLNFALFGVMLLRVAPASAGQRYQIDITGRFDAGT